SSQSVEEVAAETEARLLAAESRTPPVRTSLDQEVQRALKLCAQSKAAVVQMFSDARMGQAIELEHVAELVEEISDSVLRHPNALI
ncbi:DUF3391 domain-containing protein, partial [Escherichia coli]|uniref:DUF3391 domain-containing protein n=1 Tax=Escherichia coli TaxID=562 RepID=UPI00128FBC48